MRYEIIDVKNENSMEYVKLCIYLLDHSRAIPIEERPMVLVCPGGGYHDTSDREAEMVALQFAAMGYHAAVLRYSVAPAVYPTALLEVAKSVRTIRENAKEWRVRTDKIYIIGFSAGGHLTANYCTFWSQDWIAEAVGAEKEMLRPNGMILSYPVITSGEYAHQGSFRNLLGEECESRKAELSLENCVNDQVPRAFVWHTFQDQGVPVQNSLLFVSALVQHKIPVEYHIFENGVHGLSLANRLTQTVTGGAIQEECQCWIDLVHKWIERDL